MAKKKLKPGIYIITCIINNKVYIGRTKDYISRLLQHKQQLKSNIHHNEHLQRAYNKYKEENFTFELLEEYEEEFLCSMENWWCNMLQAHNPKYGYNIEPTSPFGKPGHSEETKKKIGKALLKNLQDDDYRKMYKEVTYAGIKNKVKKILKYDLNGNFIEEFKNMILLLEKTGLKRRQISTALNWTTKSFGGFIWIKESELHLLNQKIDFAKSTNKKAIIRYTEDLVKIDEWESIREVCRVLNISRQDISKSCKNPNTTVNSFKFRFK